VIGLVVALVVVVLVAGAVWASKHVQHPEQAAGHGEPDPTTTSERLYRGSDRPAGPDAEDTVGSGSRREVPPPA
jgi:hypothetical protein